MSKRLSWWTRLLEKAVTFFSIHIMNRRTSDVHIALYRRTGGAIGGKVVELPVLLLTTTGRKTGEPRTVPLNYLTDGENYVVTASNSGKEEPPMWFLNLQANPHAKVQVGHKTQDVISEQAGPEEKARLWAELVSKGRNYAEYKKRTQRDIPMVVLRTMRDA